MEVINNSIEVIHKLGSCKISYKPFKQVTQSLQSSLILMVEFLQCRVNTNNDLDPSLLESITNILNEISCKLDHINHIYLNHRIIYIIGFLGVNCFGMHMWIDYIHRIHYELQNLIQFVKIDLLSTNSELVYRFSSVNQDVIEDPKSLWFNLFGQQLKVPTKVFSDALVSLTSCERNIADYIACTNSSFGEIYIQNYLNVTSNRDTSTEFDIKEWIREQQITGSVRTVMIPGHTNYITQMQNYDDIILTSSRDCTLKVFCIVNETIVVEAVMVGHEKGINDFVILNESEILSCSDDHTFRKWEFTTGKLLSTIKIVDKPQKICQSSNNKNQVFYSVDENAYSIILFDLSSQEILRKLMIDVGNIKSIFCSQKDLIISSGSKILRLDEYGSIYKEYSCNGLSRCLCVYENFIIHETTSGISIKDVIEDSDKKIDIIEEPSPLFKTSRIKCYNKNIYVVWSLGLNHTYSNLTIISLEDNTRQNHELSFMKESICTNLIIYNEIIYFATLLGNIYWYTLDKYENPKGNTFNDQMNFGLGYTNVHLATYPGGILVTNKNEARLWSIKTESTKNKILPFVTVGCASYKQNFLIINSDTIYWYNIDLEYEYSIKTKWTIDKIVSSNDQLLVLYSDMNQRLSEDFFLEKTKKNIAYYDEESHEFITIPDIKPTNILVFIDKNMYISDEQNIIVINTENFQTVSMMNYSHKNNFIANSGCILNDRLYTLHSNNKVLIWGQSFSDVIITDVLEIEHSIIEIMDFNHHILGFSTTGTIYIYDEKLRLQKCLVTHNARAIHGTFLDGSADGGDNNDNRNQMVVSDHQGVLKLLAELYSTGK
ncbi:WD40 repeat-containing protein [Tetraselmis virus 1]|uniref:WD40 repeat-containing protein n=1 Tax=Tetraselmis virus 1 TaxID=2060617 RepID=A0A2P0VN58_9VIRU|nr:WD40 repeat-containing protein [Tetraselmis virus 1]AUF82179.1 WD40 repeat-containing protein [Tetraselmis virus 1]